MEEKFPKHRIREPSESPERKSGRLLTLKFSCDIRLGLDEIIFQFQGNSQPVGLRRGRNFNWTGVPKAFSVIILDFVCWKKDHQPFQIEEKNLAISVALDRSKKGLLRKLFIDKKKNGVELEYHLRPFLPDLLPGTNTPVDLKVNTDFLPADCIQIFQADRGKLQPPEIEKLRNELRKSLGLAYKEEKEFELENYANAIRSNYSHLPVEIFKANQGVYEDLPLLRLFVPPKVRECREFLSGSLEGPKEYFRQVEFEASFPQEIKSPTTHGRYVEKSLLNVIDVLDVPKNRRIVILGSLGSGKSILLRFMALRWAEAEKSNKQFYSLPILIQLESYAKARRSKEVNDFVDFLTRGSESIWKFSQREIESILAAGNATVCFDGLDDIVDPGLAEEVVACVVRFSLEHPHAKLVLTSRIVGYRGEALRKAGFAHFILQDRTESEIAQFINNWQRATPLAFREKALRLMNAIPGSGSLVELLGTPLFLTHALISGAARVPLNRMEVFEESTRLLLEGWKAEQALCSDPELGKQLFEFGVGEKKYILRHLARQMAESTVLEKEASPVAGKKASSQSGLFTNRISEVDLESSVRKCVCEIVHSDSPSLARAIIWLFRARIGILCRRDDGFYAFINRGFLDYFLADDIRERFCEKSMPNEQCLKNIFQGSWEKPEWQSALCMFCSMVDPILLQTLLGDLLKSCQTKNDQCLIFIAECLNGVKSKHKLGSLLAMVKNGLINTLAKHPLNRKAFLKLCKSSSNSRNNARKAAFYAREEEDRLSGERVRRGVGLLASLYPGPWLTKPLNSLICSEASNDTVKIAAIRMLSDNLDNNWKGNSEWHSETHTLLKSYAIGSQGCDVRGVALEELARHQPESAILEFLKKRALVETGGAQESAFFAISNGWSQNPKAIQWLEKQTILNIKWETRKAAVNGIARSRCAARGIFVPLEAYRRFYFSLFQRLYEFEPNEVADRAALHWFLRIAKSDQSPEVRSVAITALAYGWADNAETFLVIKELVFKDIDRDVQNLCCRLLCDQWAASPKCYKVLKLIGEKHSDFESRLMAATVLCQQWKDQTGAQILKKCLNNEGEMSRILMTPLTPVRIKKNGACQTIGDAILQAFLDSGGLFSE